MSFADDMTRIAVKVETTNRTIFVNTASTALESIKVGSPITGAPGQPVDTSNLRNSWQLRFPDANSAEITTNVVYAPDIEDGVRHLIGRRGDAGVSSRGSLQRLTLRSSVGGFHSVKLTVAGMAKIVEHETAKVVGGGR